MILSKHEIRELIEKQKLVEGFIDLEKQLQPASFDLTLSKVYSFEGEATIDFDNSKRVLNKNIELPFKDGFVTLEKGDYKVQFNETVRIPDGLAAFSTTRSSLARCGSFAHMGWWDPGYHGSGSSLLHVGASLKLEKNARIAQMIFLRLNDKARELYSGAYHKENV